MLVHFVMKLHFTSMLVNKSVVKGNVIMDRALVSFNSALNCKDFTRASLRVALYISLYIFVHDCVVFFDELW